MSLPNLNARAAASLEKWHAMVVAKNLDGVEAIIHPDATFRSPMAYKPYRSAQAVALLLRTVLTVFEDFAYHRQLVSEDGLSVVLEFSARAADKSLRGIDLIQFNADGLITDFEVMVRPPACKRWAPRWGRGWGICSRRSRRASRRAQKQSPRAGRQRARTSNLN